VRFSPDHIRLATGSWDNTVRVWDAGTGAEVLTLRGHTGRVFSVYFSPDGGRLASAADDNTVRVWDARTGADALALRGHPGGVLSLCFSPDGTRLASGGWDGPVRVWDASNGAEALTLHGHTGRVSSLCFSPDGTRLESKGIDGQCFTWDLTSGTRVDRRIAGASPPLRTSPDGKWRAFGEGERILLISTEPPKHGYDPWAEDDQRRHARGSMWHLEDAEQAARLDDPFALAFHLACLDALPDQGPKETVRRALVRLRTGRQATGLADLAKSAVARSDDFGDLEWHVLALVSTGDQAAYRAACARVLSLVDRSPRPKQLANNAAWLCCLGGGAVGDPEAVVRLAETGVEASGGSGTALNTLGAALLRAGHLAKAVRNLELSLRLLPTEVSAHNELLLAIAHHRLGHREEAQGWLRAAAAKMDRYRVPASACGAVGVGPVGPLQVATAALAKRPDPRAGKDDDSLRDWLEMDLLRAEAEAALAGKVAP
jgi:hypothetical protein